MYVRRKFKKIQENWVFRPFFPISQGLRDTHYSIPYWLRLKQT